VAGMAVATRDQVKVAGPAGANQVGATVAAAATVVGTAAGWVEAEMERHQDVSRGAVRAEGEELAARVVVQ